jgi:histidine triad (HIT) family protein
MDCIFCKILNGEIPASKVYEDDNVLAFLDIMPATPKKGHVIVIPKKHYEMLEDVSDDDLTALILVVKKVQKGILKWAEGTNIFQNNGKSSGQIVNHVHFHIVPRFEGDGVKLAESETFQYQDSEMVEMQEKIKKLLNESSTF